MNPIQAIVKGTKETVTQAAAGTYQQIRASMPSMSNAVYRMGIVGPLAQNIVSNMGDKKKSEQQDQSPASSEARAVVQSVSTLSNQMKNVVTLLTQIKMIGIAQLNAVQRASYERQRSLFEAEENRMEATLQKPGAAATPTASAAAKKGEDGFFSKVLSTIGNMPFWVQLLGAGIVGKSIWNMLDENTKKELKGAASELFQSILSPVLKSVFDTILNNPGFVAGLAAVLAPRLTSKALMGVTKFLFPSAGAAAAAGGAAAVTGAAAAASVGPAISATQTPKNVPPMMSPSPGGKLRPAHKVPPTQTPASPPTPPAPQPKAAGGLMGKLGPMLGKILAPIAATMSGLEAYNQAKEGNMLSAGLHGASAAMAMGALVPSPASPFLAAGAVLTGILGSVFGGGKKEDSSKGVEGQPPPTGTGSTSDPFAGLKMGSDTQANERTGGGATAFGVVDLAQKIQSSISGIKEFTAFNDKYHQANTPYASKHKEGLAMDFTVNDPTQSAQVAQHVTKLLNDMGLKSDQFTVRDEYKNPSAKSTAGHIHVQLKDVETANKVALQLGRSGEQLAAGAFVAPTGGALARQMATPDTAAATQVADASTSFMESLRTMMSGGGIAGGGPTVINNTSVGGGGGPALASVATPVSNEHVQYLQNARHVSVG